MACRSCRPAPLSRQIPSGFPILLCALLLTHTAALAGGAAPRELWYGVYLDGRRAGYLVTTEQRTTWRGRPADLTTTRMRTDLRVLGAPATSQMEGRVWTTPDGAPLEQALVEKSGEQATRVRAVYDGGSVRYDADLNGLRRSGALRLKPGERFWADDPFAGAKNRAVETRIRYKKFNTTTLSLEDADVAVGKRTAAARREIVDVGGQGVAAYRLPLKIGGAPAAVWVDKDEEMLRFDVGPARIVRQPKHVASAPLSSLVEVTRLAAYAPDKPISNARTLRTARYRVENLSAPLETASDDVQAATVEKTPAGTYTATIAVTTGPIEGAPSTRLDAVARADFAAYLKPSLYVPSDSAQMTALARRILGGETDAGRAAGKLCAWVHKNLTYDPGQGVGLQRHAAQVLKSGRGVCQDYAALLVTLARAAGIPAKHCAGIVYGDDKFYAHAWAELWVGRWVALEPTWGDAFADATHIKLAEGEPTAERKGLSRLDPLRITVLGGDAPAAPSPTVTGVK